MRVMVLVKASLESEAGQLSDTAILTAMGSFNQDHIDAGMGKKVPESFRRSPHARTSGSRSSDAQG